VARLYDQMHAPEADRRAAGADRPGNGGFTHPFFKTARSSADLVLARDAIVAWQRLAYGWMGRSPDYQAALLGTFGVTPTCTDLSAPTRPGWYKESQERLPFFNHAFVHSADRPRQAGRRGRRRVCPRRRGDRLGLIVSGAKVVATSAALTNMNFVAHNGAARQGQEVRPDVHRPMATSGLKLLCALLRDGGGRTGQPVRLPALQQVRRERLHHGAGPGAGALENVFIYDAEAANDFMIRSGFLSGSRSTAARGWPSSWTSSPAARSSGRVTGASVFRGVQAYR